jgi:hypothetical protein
VIGVVISIGDLLRTMELVMDKERLVRAFGLEKLGKLDAHQASAVRGCF